MKPARRGRYGLRDSTMILVAYRHDLRASEIANPPSRVRRSRIHVRRVKNGKRGDEVRALRELRRQFPDTAFVFTTERGSPFTADAINRHVKRIGAPAHFAFPVHAHVLRHGCGYALADHDMRRIQMDWLGHRSIEHTTRHTQLSGAPFKDFWR
jgi:integrase